MQLTGRLLTNPLLPLPYQPLTSTHKARVLAVGLRLPPLHLGQEVQWGSMAQVPPTSPRSNPTASAANCHSSRVGGCRRGKVCNNGGCRLEEVCSKGGYSKEGACSQGNHASSHASSSSSRGDACSRRGACGQLS